MMPAEMAAEEKPKSLVFRLFKYTVLALMLYVLGLGPAAKLAAMKKIPDRVVQTAYTPIFYLERTEPAKKVVQPAVRWYLNLWKVPKKTALNRSFPQPHSSL